MRLDLAAVARRMRPGGSAADPSVGIADRARLVFERETRAYGGVDLHPVERRLLAEVGTRWGGVSMLDLGVGTGRTTLTFGAICGEYVGVDYAPEMVRVARERTSGVPRARLRQGDARALPEFADGSFDVVLFSFNGIDNLDDDGRQVSLREVRRLLRPGGIFVFSSHTLAPPRLRLPSMQWRRPLWSLRLALSAVRNRIMFRLVNGAVDFPAARARGHAVLVEGHGFTLPQYYVTPAQCARQIAAAGLELEAVFDPNAERLLPPYVTSHPWVFYWCRRTA